jgi:hypothetical protein
VSDVVTVAGAAGATGTGSWQLLGPIAPNRQGTCTGLDWSGAQVRAAGSFDVALAATQYATDAVELTSSGCYSYVESMAQTDRTNAAATQPGDPAETVLVNDPPAPVSQPAGPAQPTPAPQPGTGDSANGSTPLAYTGAPVAQGMVAAAALLLFGTVLVIAARRRRYRSE